MRPRADRPVNKSCEVTVPGSPGRGNGENRPSGQPAADNRSGPAVSRKPESDRLLVIWSSAALSEGRGRRFNPLTLTIIPAMSLRISEPAPDLKHSKELRTSA